MIQKLTQLRMNLIIKKQGFIIKKGKIMNKLFFIFLLYFLPLINIHSLEQINNQNQLKPQPQEEETETNIPKIIEKIEIDYDNPPKTYYEMLEPLPKVKYYYEPFIKTLDLTLDFSSLLQYLSNEFAFNDRIINPELGLGILWKKGIYTSISGGYSIIECKTIPRDDYSFKYSVDGPFWHIGIGYKFEYKNDNLIGFIFKYGGSYFNKIAEKKDIKLEGLHAHWIKFIIDAKSKIFKNFNLFFGVELGLKVLLHQVKPEDKLECFMIPNYGMNTNKFGLTYSIYLQYSIPFYKEYISIFN